MIPNGLLNSPLSPQRCPSLPPCPSFSQLMHFCFPIVLSLCHCRALFGPWVAVEGGDAVSKCLLMCSLHMMLDLVVRGHDLLVFRCGRSKAHILIHGGGSRQAFESNQTNRSLDIGSSIKHTLRLYQPSMQRCHSQVSKLLAAGSQVERGPAVNQLARAVVPNLGAGASTRFWGCTTTKIGINYTQNSLPLLTFIMQYSNCVVSVSLVYWLMANVQTISPDLEQR